MERNILIECILSRNNFALKSKAFKLYCQKIALRLKLLSSPCNLSAMQQNFFVDSFQENIAYEHRILNLGRRTFHHSLLICNVCDIIWWKQKSDLWFFPCPYSSSKNTQPANKTSKKQIRIK